VGWSVEEIKLNYSSLSILIVSPRYPPYIGGQERQVQDLAVELAAQGHSVSIVTERLERFKNEHSVTNRVEVSRLGTRGSRLTAALKFLKFFLTNLTRYDVVICRTFSVGSFLMAVIPRNRLKAHAVRILMMDSESETEVLSHGLLGRFLVDVFASFDYLTAPSRPTFANLHDLGFPEDLVRLIPNGVSFSNVVKQVEVNRTPRNFLYIGSMARTKGIHDLYQSFINLQHTIPDATLTFIGDGPDKAALFAQMVLEKVNGVFFESSVIFSEVAEVVSKYDCIVIPSHSEGFGLIAYEAATLPVHMICSNVADFNHLLQGRSEFFEPGDNLGLEKRLRKIALLEPPVAYKIPDSVLGLTFRNLLLRLEILWSHPNKHRK
jgi:glycosyltransferase involved in cell wall biosynthesis